MRHVLLSVSLVSALLLTSCQRGGDGVIDVVHDPCGPIVLELSADVTPEQRVAVADAASLWNVLAGTQLTLDDVAGAARVPVHFAKAATAFRGVYDDERGVVILNDKLVGGVLEVVAAHELGHAFGLFHATGDTVMVRGNVSIPPTETDVAALTNLWGRCK